jgi:hypothetical protein
MFQRKPLTLSISMALGAMGAVSTVAQADTLFFPHVVHSDTVTTVVSVVNTSDYLWDSTGEKAGYAEESTYENLHWRLWHKVADQNDAPCQEYNVHLPTSYLDLQSVDLGAKDGSGVIFEDRKTDKDYNVDWEGHDYAILAEARKIQKANAVRGFLLIDNPVGSCGNGGPGKAACMTEQSNGGSPFGSLYGEAVIIEFNNGASWGYQAYSQAGNEFDYEAYGAISGHPLTLLPFEGGPASTATTAFLVTPLVDNVAPKGKSWADSEMDKANDYTATLSWMDGLWDRDENWVSSGRPQSVTCIGRIDATELLPGAVPTTLANGGWGHLYNWTNYTYVNTITSSGNPAATQTAKAEQEHVAVIYKLEYGNAFDGVSLNGVFNNAYPIHPAGCGEGWIHHCDREM